MPRAPVLIDPELGAITDDRLTRDVRVYQRAKGHRFSADDVATAFVAYHAAPAAKTVLDLLRVMKSEGRTVIVSTHVMPLVEEICDRVGIIFDGVLHGDAPPREVLQRWNAKTLDEVFFQLAAGGAA